VASDFVQFTLAVLALVFGAGLEELLPKILGVGFPLLLTASQFFATRRGALAMALFAIAAGAMEDAVSMLPAMTSVSYFLLVAVLSRYLNLPRAVTLLTYPGYQLWLYLWMEDIKGGIYSRLLVSLPVGMASAFAVWAVFSWLERAAASDAEE
jgi:hypothetical protein